jgi:hypothetical protein
MKDIYSLIRQKEADLERIQHELEALRLSAKLLEDDSRPSAAASPNSVTSAYTPTKPQTTPAATPTAWATAKQFP